MGILFAPTTIVYAKDPEPVQVIQEWTEERIVEEIRRIFPEQPETMIRIARCESGLDYDVISKTNDRGLMQINMQAHGKELERLGVDPLTVEGNLSFARKLYDERGTQPWYMSKHCWNKAP